MTRETELNFEYQVRSKAERQARGIGDDGVLSSPADPAASAPAGNGDGGDTAAPAASHTDPTVRASKEPKVETQGGKGLNEANHTSLPFQVKADRAILNSRANICFCCYGGRRRGTGEGEEEG